MKQLLHRLSGLLLLTALSQVESFMWKLKPNAIGGYRQEYNLGNAGWRQPYGQWDAEGRSNQWNYNSGSSWNYPAGNNKGSYARRCYDSRQCGQGECCQHMGYSNSGMCRFSGYAAQYGCPDRPRDVAWIQRPVYPGNNKGNGISMMQYGRPGACPPPQHAQGPFQYCRQDENCPNNQKCCYLQGKTVCLHAIFA